MSTKFRVLWDKVFKSGPSKICGKQPLKSLKQTISPHIFKGCLLQILLGRFLNLEFFVPYKGLYKGIFVFSYCSENCSSGFLWLRLIYDCSWESNCVTSIPFTCEGRFVETKQSEICEFLTYNMFFVNNISLFLFSCNILLKRQMKKVIYITFFQKNEEK